MTFERATCWTESLLLLRCRPQEGVPMLNLQYLREPPEQVRAALARRHTPVPLDELLDLDRRRREVLVELEGLRARRNEVSKQIGQMKERPPELIAEMRRVGDTIKGLET